MIKGQVTGDKEVIARLQGMPERIRREVLRSTKILAIALTRHIKEKKLTGQVLKNRTGTLRRSINYRIDEGTEKISGIVGTNKEYAAVHEYGFQGTVQVKQHMRMQRQAWGRPISPREVLVRAHTAKMNLPERSFLRSSLREMADQIRAEYEAAAQRAIKAK